MDGDPLKNEGRGGLVCHRVPGLSRRLAEEHPPRSGLIPDREAETADGRQRGGGADLPGRECSSAIFDPRRYSPSSILRFVFSWLIRLQNLKQYKI